MNRFSVGYVRGFGFDRVGVIILLFLIVFCGSALAADGEIRILPKGRIDLSGRKMTTVDTVKDPSYLRFDKTVLIRISSSNDPSGYKVLRFVIPVFVQLSTGDKIELKNPLVETQAFQYELKEGEEYATKHHVFKAGSCVFLRTNMLYHGGNQYKEAFPFIDEKTTITPTDKESMSVVSGSIFYFYTLDIVEYDKKTLLAGNHAVIDGNMEPLQVEFTIFTSQQTHQKEVF